MSNAGPARLAEARRLLAQLGKHGGRINIRDPRFAFRRVNLARMPVNWLAEARGIDSAWRPYVCSSQD